MHLPVVVQAFGDAFHRFARWSEKKPVPELGTAETDMEAVDRFYDFWNVFKSWRDFSYYFEYNLDDVR